LTLSKAAISSKPSFPGRSIRNLPLSVNGNPRGGLDEFFGLGRRFPGFSSFDVSYENGRHQKAFIDPWIAVVVTIAYRLLPCGQGVMGEPMVQAAGTLLLVCILFLSTAIAASPGGTEAGAKSETGAGSELTLGRAAVCEGVKEREPVNGAVLFSVRLKRLYCFTAFEVVPYETVIHHIWYQRDVQRADVKLKVQPPRWSTYSTVSLRDSDKGPWRVDITDDGGRVLRTLRFSITD
jgi:hypothetical protein